MKKSFLNYLHFAVKHGFLHRWEYTNTTQYGISNNGLIFLKLFKVSNAVAKFVKNAVGIRQFLPNGHE